MTMTAEQLEELLGKVTPGEWTWERKRNSGFISALTSAATYDDIVCAEEYAGSCWLEVENESNATLIALAPSLARKVIAADKLVEALSGITEVGKTGHHSIAGDWLVSRKLMTAASIALTAYREASK